MKKRKTVFYTVALLLALILAVELIWMGTGIGREDLPERPASETAEIFPELVDAAEHDEQPDDSGDEPEDQQEEEEETPPEEQQQLISQELLSAETPEEISEKKEEASKNPDEKKPGDGEGEGGGESPDQPGDGDDEEKDPEPTPKPEKKEVRIVTDLGDYKMVDYGSLPGDMLNFYVYLENAADDMELQVSYAPPGKGERKLTGEGKDYSAKLGKCSTSQEVNHFYVKVLQKGKEILKKTYNVRYRPKQADEDNPSTGAGVTIEVKTYTLHEWNETANQNPTVVIRAVSNESGKELFADDLKIYVDGKLQSNQPTGGPWYEYQLYLESGYSGDWQEHKVEILAVDSKNTENTAYTWFGLKFHTVEEGEVIGTAYIQLDASTIGWGPIDDPWPVEIRQGEPASYAVKAALEENGIEIEYSGTLDIGFYIRGLNLGDCSGLEPDELLWKLIDKDGLTRTGSYPDAVLREHNFTQGSGWMFSVGGDVYSGKGLSGYYLSPGETLYLRYTCAYGKDIGGSSTQGNLSTYCTSWINGAVLENHRAGSEEIKKEATCTEDGIKNTSCSICGTVLGNQAIPALGHDYHETGRTEAAPGIPGEIVNECSRCGDRKTEEIPALPEVTPEPMPEPGPENPLPDTGGAPESSEETGTE